MVRLTPEELSRLEEQAWASLERFHVSRNVLDIDEAISAQKQVIASSPVGIPSLGVRIKALGDSYGLRFEKSARILDACAALSCMRKACRLGAAVDNDLAKALWDAGVALVQRFGRENRVSDLDKSVSVLQESVDITPFGDPSLSIRLNALGIAFKRRFQRHGRYPDLQSSVTAHRRVYELQPCSPAYMNNLADVLSVQAQQTDMMSDLVESIDLLRLAVETASPNDQHLSQYLLNLGGNLKLRFELTENKASIDESINILKRAAEVTKEGDLDQPANLMTLGAAYSQRYERYMDPTDIHAGISYMELGLALTSPKDRMLPMRLNHYGKALNLRYQLSGDISDLHEMVVLRRKAVTLTSEDDPSIAGLLDELAVSLGEKHARTKDLDDLDESIDASRRAIRVSREDHPRLQAFWKNLATSLETRYHITKSDNDLTEALSIFRSAIEDASSTGSISSTHLSDLASALCARYQQTGVLAALHESIRLYEQAEQRISVNSPLLNTLLYNYSNTLRLRFDELHMIEDLNTAISLLRQVISSTSEQSPDLVDFRGHLAQAYFQRFQESGDFDDLQTSAGMYKNAAYSPAGPPSIRVKYAGAWAEVLDILDSPQSLEAYGLTIDLVSLVAGLEQSLTQRHSSLESTNHVVTKASAAAIDRGEVEVALEWLEQGRCLVWKQLHDLRMPIDHLKSAHPDLAQQVLSLSQVIEAASSKHSVSGERMLENRTFVESEEIKQVKMVREWDEVLARVRELEGFENFLRRSPISDTLSHLPVDGPTIVLTSTKRRTDAIILAPSPSSGATPRLFRLSEFDVYQADMLYNKYRRCLEGAELVNRGAWGEKWSDVQNADGSVRAVRKIRKTTTQEDTLQSVLEELWERVLKPIVQHLGLSPSTDPSERTRIYWCPTGPFTMLPIHAAGIYGPNRVGTGEALMEYAISSITPTLAALSDRVKPSLAVKVSNSRESVLLISQPETPGQVKIPGVTSEVAAIRDVLSHLGAVQSLDGDEGTTDRVKSLMSLSSIVHLACHAEQNTEDPLQSGFYLHNGMLSLSTLIQRRPASESNSNKSNAGTPISFTLAFLSACQTGTGKQTLSEEAAHIAAGMLAAGYKGVVGTMWSIPDAYAPMLAKEFYKRLVEPGGGGIVARIDTSRSAYALHCATEELRRYLGDSEGALLAWVPYVYFGL
ncbi:CHAT domain-containing protein [Ephemerocybe angulata]|uniref:CHAT domain-containing protein n=1 Tax=Ephemerocybe angulata TaxID=980116 RepID=A0A8H6HRJ2_9AGAR|nr:CHAT domain-containing protein [Tulosesus angulatus]